VIGADELSCDWKNKSLAINYRERADGAGDVFRSRSSRLGTSSDHWHLTTMAKEQTAVSAADVFGVSKRFSSGSLESPMSIRIHGGQSRSDLSSSVRWRYCHVEVVR